MASPIYLMPWQEWLEGSTHQGLSTRPSYMCPLFHGDPRKSDFLCGGLRLQKGNGGSKKEDKSYNISLMT